MPQKFCLTLFCRRRSKTFASSRQKNPNKTPQCLTITKNDQSNKGATTRQKKYFRIGELNPGLVGSGLLSQNESDKS